MATGILTAGVDLDSKFLARSTTKRADVGFKSNSAVDISNRFEKYTSGAKVAATNLKSAGVDLCDLFQNIAVPLGPAVTMPANGTIYTRSGATPATIVWQADGAFTENTDQPGFTWLTSGTAAQCDIFVTLVSGTFQSGTVGAWTNMATNRQYDKGAAAAAIGTVVFNVSIRNASTLAVIGTATNIQLVCDRT